MMPWLALSVKRGGSNALEKSFPRHRRPTILWMCPHENVRLKMISWRIDQPAFVCKCCPSEVKVGEMRESRPHSGTVVFTMCQPHISKFFQTCQNRLRTAEVPALPLNARIRRSLEFTDAISKESTALAGVRVRLSLRAP